MQFRYVAIEPDGRESRGVMDAGSANAVIEKLHREGRMPVSAAPLKARSTRKPRVRGLSARSLPGFTRRLAQMLGAGLTLAQALKALSTDDDDAAATLGVSIRGGSSFADALAAFGAPFDQIYVGLVRAGEAAGDLTGALQRLADQLERARATREAMQAALIYPALLLLTSAGVLALLIGFVTPRFEALFADAGAQLPMATRVVIALGAGARDLWMAPLIAFIAGFFLWRLASRDQGMRLSLSEWRLSAPVIGPLMVEAETARLARVLGALLSGGAPALKAVRLAGDTLQSEAMRARLMRARAAIEGGDKIADAFVAEAIGGPDFQAIVKAGEASGGLAEALSQAGEIAADDLTRRVKTLVALIEPAIILTLGGLIGAIVISLFIGIMSVNDLAF